ncbi:MAG: diacylglycerol kinase [Rhodobacteraceae bacterium]|nr:diacylglycerol kinase [Paracoccaceae bacterium]
MKFFFTNLKDRCVWSWHGVRDTWASEYSFRSWVFANFASILLAFLLPLTSGERALILALGVLVLASELFNTAIERCVDYISEEQHPLAKKAKDAGSAGVAVTAIAAGVAWVVVLVRVFG